MSTLTETINAMMTPELFRSLAVRAGVSETKVRTGMTAATGAIMEGLARHAHNPSVMDDTVQLIDRTPEVSDPLVAVEEDDRMRSASGQLVGLATNDTGGVTKRLANSLGVGTGVASSLLAASSSIILNGLHRFSRARGGMDSTALSATLLAEAPGFFAAMPGPMPSSWRQRERIERPAARPHERRWLWLLALIPIVAIGAWLINRHERGERRNATPMGKVTEPDRMAPQKRAITPPAPEPKSVVPEEPAPMSERQTMPDQTRAEPMTDQKLSQQAQWQLPLPSDQDQQVSGAESPAIGADAQQAQESDQDQQVSGAESQTTGDAQQAQESSQNQQALGPESQQEQQTNQDQGAQSQQDQQRKQEQQAQGEQQPAEPQQPPININPGTPPSEQPPVEINPGTPAGQPQQPSKPPTVAEPEQPSAGTGPQTTQPPAPEGSATAAIEAQIESPNPPEEGVTLDEVKFDAGRADIKAGAEEQLSRVAELMDANPNVRIQIDGYTDLTGNKDANMKLSQKRADAAKDALMQRGIDGSRIEAKGKGQEDPMEETPVGSEANRRVTVLVVSR